MLKLTFAVVASIGASAPIMAQDLQTYSDAVTASGQVAVLQNMRDGDHRYPRRNGDGRITAEAAATCRNKGQAAANLGRSHPKVKGLYQLCARAGY